MLDVFLCIYEPRNLYWQAKVVDHWRRLCREYRAHLTILVPDLMPMEEARELVDLIAPYPIEAMKGPLSEFQRQRRILAERLAKTRIYVVADDDCLLDEPGAIPHALEILFGPEHESFAVVAPLPSNANISLWTPEGYTPAISDDIIEHVNVGCIRFCRKGVMPADSDLWRPQPPRTEFGWKYDGPHGEQVRERGYRMGYFRNITLTHLGERVPRPNSLLVN